ncbi:MAG: TraR/DksA family transcriptional regulator [Burkholderiaceae bacterium]|nr:TraR/DksA family transcriptional regulator [Burkholderiaceae bacterium]
MNAVELGSTTRQSLVDALMPQLRARRSDVAAALSTHLHPGARDEAGLPRRGEETDDDGAAETQRERDVAELARLTAELAQIDAAIARAHEGDLGDCVDCGEAIDAARLAINPAAARCAECQQLEERRQARARRLGA